MKPVFFLLITLLSASGLEAQKTYTYSWERYGLSFSSSLVMNEMSDADSWDVDDDEFDMWVGAQRFPFDSVPVNPDFNDNKTVAFVLSDNLEYEVKRNGGKLKTIPDAYYLVLRGEYFIKARFIVIIDRPNRVVYTVLVEDLAYRKSKIWEIINSLRLNPL